MRTVVITFKGVSGDPRCLKAREVIRRHGGTVRNTSLFPGMGEVDIEVAVPPGTLAALVIMLERDGYVVVVYPPD